MYYIGQTRESLKRRDWGHKHNKISKSHFDRAYQKYPEQFTMKTLLEVNTKSKELLVKTLNIMEIAYISLYKSKNRCLYNILSGGNQGWRNTPLTQPMIDALNLGREIRNTAQSAKKFSPEERAKRHNESAKKYAKAHPEKYKEIYTKANQRRKEAKREWYLKNKERLYSKLKEKRASQKALSNAEKNSSSILSLP